MSPTSKKRSRESSLLGLTSSVITCRNRGRPRLFSHSNLQPVKATCRAITQALISRKICIIHGTRRGCRVQYPAEVDRRALPEPTGSAIDHLKTRRYSNLYARCGAPGLDGVHPGAPPAPRVHLKYLNGLILSIEPRSTGTRDETTLTLSRPGGRALANFRCRWNAQRNIADEELQ